MYSIENKDPARKMLA